MVDIMSRITELMNQRNWSAYKLAKFSGLSSSTINNMFHRNTTPSITTLMALCNAFGITLSQFFSDDSTAIPLTSEQIIFFEHWAKLTPAQKELIYKIIFEFK